MNRLLREICWFAYKPILKQGLKKAKKEFGIAEVDDVIKYIDEDKNIGVPVFTGEWTKKYEHFSVTFNTMAKDLYVFDYDCFGGAKKSLYIAEEDEKSAVNYYRSIVMEQDPDSPHFYFSDKAIDKAKNGTVIDIGAAEGNFELYLSDLIKKAYVFEPDTMWNVPVQKTFDKCDFDYIFVNKFVSDKTRESKNIISLDDYFGNDIPTDISIIKMDIEGMEQNAIRGMKRVLEKNPEAVLLVCAYHTRNAEKEILSLLKNYNIQKRNGKMLFPYDKREFRYPYFRTGVIEASRI